MQDLSHQEAQNHRQHHSHYQNRDDNTGKDTLGFLIIKIHHGEFLLLSYRQTAVHPLSLNELLSVFSPLYGFPGNGIAGQGIPVAVIKEHHAFLSPLYKVSGQDLCMGSMQ